MEILQNLRSNLKLFLLRFFADGTVFMVNTAETPASIVGHLKNKNAKLNSLIRGSYITADDLVYITFKMKRPKRDTNAKSKNKFNTIMYHLVSYLIVVK